MIRPDHFMVFMALLMTLLIAIASSNTRAYGWWRGTLSTWTLFTFVRYPDGFQQQELSGHDTLDECIARFHDPRRYHQAPVESGRCVYFNNLYPSVELRP